MKTKNILKSTLAVVAVTASCFGAWKAYGTYVEKSVNTDVLLEENVVAFSEFQFYVYYLCATDFNYDRYTASVDAALCPPGTKYYHTIQEAINSGEMVPCKDRKLMTSSIKSDYAYCYVK